MNQSRVYIDAAIRLSLIAIVIAAGCMWWLFNTDGFEGLFPMILLITIPGALLLIAGGLAVRGVLLSRNLYRSDSGHRLFGWSLAKLSTRRGLAGLYLLSIASLLIVSLAGVLAAPTSGWLMLVIFPISALALVAFQVIPIICLCGLLIERSNVAKLVPGVIFLAWAVLFWAQTGFMKSI